jgi:hypothetical protein
MTLNDLSGNMSEKSHAGYNWFLIMCSWECDHDKDAMETWKEVYNVFIDKTRVEKNPDIHPDGLLALNLIGQRKFVIAAQIRSNAVLQQISAMITLEKGIKVDVFPATNVFEFGNINKAKLKFTYDPLTKKLT